MIHFDTSYLIDLLRETTRERPGDAMDFIEGLAAAESLAVSVHVVIATAALLDDAPVVTRNVKDFSRIPGLRVLRY